MSDYSAWNSLNDLVSAEPLDGSSPAELLEAHRQLKAIVKNALLAAHYPDGRLRPDAISEVPDGSVGAAQIADGVVTGVKIAEGTISSSNLADDVVTGAKLAAGSITAEHFSAESIPTEAFQANTIPFEALADFITADFISSSSTDNSLRAITADAIADDAVTDRTIADVSLAKLTGGSDQDMLIKLAGTWTSVAITGGLSYDSGTNAFTVDSGIKVVTVAETKSRGTPGGSGTAGAWNIRTLGEMSDPDNLISFSASKFKLVVGKYFFYVTCPAHQVDGHQTRLFDVTNDTVVVWGSSAHCAPTAAQTNSTLMGFFEVTDPDNEYQVEHWIETHTDGADFGQAAASDNTLPVTSAPFVSQREIYSQGFAIKIS